MSPAIGVGLFFLASFALIFTALRMSGIMFYTGGIFVALFILGLFYAYLNAMRQSRKVKSVEEEQPAPSQSEGAQ